MNRIPPETLTTDAVTLRRWRVDDAPSLTEMIVSSLDHLRPWMPWVQSEPLSLEARVEKIKGWATAWDAAQDFTFAIDDGAGGLLGVCGLHQRREPAGLEIGYWVRSGRTGQGIATAAVRGLVQAALSIDGVAYLEIHHDAANIASARVPEKVGFTRVSEQPDVPAAPSEVGIDVTWRLHRTRARRRCESRRRLHAGAHRAVVGLAEGSTVWAIPWPCVHEFLGIVTRASLWKRPSTGDEALAQVRAWLASPTVRPLAESDHHLDLLADLMTAGQITGAKVHDARIAALCVGNGVLHLPGHSPGSIGLWDAASGTLFSGDALYDGPLLDELPESNIPDYCATMERLLTLPVQRVHAGHDPSFDRARLHELCRAYLKQRS